MDLWLLHLCNQIIVHPLLDLFMVGCTTLGLALLPSIGYFLVRRGETDTGKTILVALGVGMLFTLVFYYLAMRPRPTHVRLIMPQPMFPSYPSGHAVAAFATAAVLIARFRRWWFIVIALLGASLIAFSRIYLGHHYPSDVFGGALLGSAIGVTTVGLFGTSSALLDRLRWLVWLQAAIVILVTQMAYLDILPKWLLGWPFADKVMHFLLFGAVVFWLNLWWSGYSLTLGPWSAPLAVVAPFALALMEESFQAWSPLRTADLTDLLSDLAGMVCFWLLSQWFVRGASRVPGGFSRE